MNKIAFLGGIVTERAIIDDGLILVSNGTIEYAGKRNGMRLPDDTRHYEGKLLAPGFVDIHCHGGGHYAFHEDPVEAMAFHRAHGTTAMLCTLYRDLNHEKTLDAIRMIKKAMKACPEILGVHMEGPYINPLLGAKSGTVCETVDYDKYMAIAASGVVRQWTYSPEVASTETFVKDIVKAGIVPAIGHSNAAPEKIYQAAGAGARIVTHLLNATGCFTDMPKFCGIRELSFDEAAMLCEDLFCEIILDKNGVHVRHDMVRLVIRAVGISRIVGITDHYASKVAEEDSEEFDINYENGELVGSRLTMDNVARNFHRLGLTLPEVFRIVSLNPAKAIKADKIVGSLQSGRRADILITDNNLNGIEVVNL